MTYQIEADGKILATIEDAAEAAELVQIDTEEMLWAIAEYGLCEVGDFVVTEI